VDGESGGISRVKSRSAAEGVELPEGVSPEQAATLVSTLAKFSEDAGLFDAVSAVSKVASDVGGQQSSPLDPHEVQDLQLLLKKLSGATNGVDVFGHTLKDLRTRAKTRMTAGTRWQGGSGFMSASMSPSMYEVIDGDIYLSELATNGAFSQAMAGQLRYRRLTGDPVFCGVKGRSKLAVVDGVADENVVRTVVQSLDNGAKAMIVAKAVLPEAVQLLQELSPGSRLRRAPDDLFTKGTVK
jgi:adenine-specific DNA-methyltransferase